MSLNLALLRRGCRNISHHHPAAVVGTVDNVTAAIAANSLSTVKVMDSFSSLSFSTSTHHKTINNATNEIDIDVPYAIRRAEYKRAVRKLRSQYASEIQRQTQIDQESKQKQKQKVTRQRLERQRLKNIRSAQNALRQEQIRVQSQINFEQHLVQQANKNKIRASRFEKAKKLVVEELEQQATYWMTSAEEVNAQLCTTQNPTIEQQLWTRPGSFIGEPTPSNDATFWKYESHTWKLQSTYPTAKEKLLSQLQENVYDATNVDYTVYWNAQRIEEQNELEHKAKLRSLVMNEGKRVLLEKQRQLMQDSHVQQQLMNTEECIVPPKLSPPVPSTDVLINYKAMEEEGVKVLKQDPTRFFVFNNSNSNAADAKNHHNEESSSSPKLSDLGTPIGLVDPIRDSSFTNTPFPELIGRMPKADLRTEREKKKQEREEKMLAAAAAAGADGGTSKEHELDAEIENEISYSGGTMEQDVNYELLSNIGDEDDQEWEEGLDPILDKELYDTPYDERYTEDDVEWIIEKLEKKVESLKEILKLEVGSDMNNMSLLKDTVSDAAIDESEQEDEVLKAMGPGTAKTTHIDEKGREYTSYDVIDDHDQYHSSNIDEFDDIMDVLSGNDLNDLIQMEDKDHVLKTLNEEQISALQSLQEEDSEGSTTGDKNSHDTAIELKEKLSKVPGLSDSQIQSLVDLEMALTKNADVQRKLQQGKKKIN